MLLDWLLKTEEGNIVTTIVYPGTALEKLEHETILQDRASDR